VASEFVKGEARIIIPRAQGQLGKQCHGEAAVATFRGGLAGQAVAVKTPRNG
jgi:hypothetical protein